MLIPEDLADSGLERFVEFCDKLEDPRKSSHVRYPLVEVLFLCICSIVSGYESNRGIENFGKLKLAWLRQYFAYRHGIPTHETIGDVIGFLDKQAFESAFISWVATYFGTSKGLLIHLDGKRLSNSAPRMLQDKKQADGGRRPEAIVNAYASANGIVVAHTSISDHGDEKQGAKQIIDQLNLKNATLTGDSNFCDRTILQKIRRKKGHYIMALKKNNPTLYQLAEQYFGDVRVDKMPHYTEENGHGRIECRTYLSMRVDYLPDEKFKEYPGLHRIVKVRRTRTVLRKNKVSDDIHYYITDLDKPVQELAQAIRDHWRIENNLHWVLDTEFKEDQSTKRTGHQAANFSLIRKIALNMINHHREKKSIKAMRMACALSDEIRHNVLGFS